MLAQKNYKWCERKSITHIGLVLCINVLSKFNTTNICWKKSLMEVWMDGWVGDLKAVLRIATAIKNLMISSFFPAWVSTKYIL